MPIQNKRILLVEDHADTSEVATLILRRAGYEVVQAATKAQAIKLCKEQSFNLLLGDIRLPDGNGYDLMRELAKICAIKGIAFTAYGYEADIEKSREAGFSGHLLKPVDMETLLSSVRKALAE